MSAEGRVKAAYMPLYVRDWRSDARVALLDWERRALYLDLLMLSWELGPLPHNPTALARTIGYPGGSAAVEELLAEFFERGEHGWTNPRLEIEREKLRELLERRSRSGAKGAEARWQTHCDRNATANGKQHGKPMARAPEPDPEPEPEPEPVPSSSEVLKTDTSSLRSEVPAPAGAGGLLPGIGDGPPKSAKPEPTQAQTDRATVQPIWLELWLAKFGRPYGGLTGSGKSVPMRAAALRNVFVKLDRDEAEFRRHVERFIADPPFKARQNPDPIALQEFFDSVRASLNITHGATHDHGSTRYGTPKSSRRPDGTRPGEYPEPLQYPRIVDLDAG
jgi:uncharacterized protein YdaU (DUF1376 family)